MALTVVLVVFLALDAAFETRLGLLLLHALLLLLLLSLCAGMTT